MDISKELFISDFGVHIRQLREKKNMSQQDLANDCSMSKRQIGRIERGEINTSLGTIINIANALEIEPKDLLNFTSK
ncbi:helix-turn-helix transcriptional regulator [Flavobacterium pectinovorum]|uniref:helix-turn-helix domain-containing protein n=1 Tax=Flavobacterium pectinovorum TaxID=29533 RepID=UPI00265E137F|nr:helix-turn-helix transcriptional regulator [Flavobacterium pectinovorum]WKL47633.1 helix-turn-helix transcriptional regulator [Flavobacterium pectinovorum]